MHISSIKNNSKPTVPVNLIHSLSLNYYMLWVLRKPPIMIVFNVQAMLTAVIQLLAGIIVW